MATMLNKNEHSFNNKPNVTGFQRSIRRFDLWDYLGFDQPDRDDSSVSNSVYRDNGFPVSRFFKSFEF